MSWPAPMRSWNENDSHWKCSYSRRRRSLAMSAGPFVAWNLRTAPATTRTKPSPSIERDEVPEAISLVVDHDGVDGLARDERRGEHRDQVDGGAREREEQRALPRAYCRPHEPVAGSSALFARRRHVRPLPGEPT